jgi:hypothetical protein
VTHADVLRLLQFQFLVSHHLTWARDAMANGLQWHVQE